MAKKSQSTSAKLERLHRFNLIMAGLHGFQAILILLISTDFKLPVIGSFLSFNRWFFAYIFIGTSVDSHGL